jgi:hypothetical protein
MGGRSIAAASAGVSVKATAGTKHGGIALSRTHLSVGNDFASSAGPPRHVLIGMGALF